MFSPALKRKFYQHEENLLQKFAEPSDTYWYIRCYYFWVKRGRHSSHQKSGGAIEGLKSGKALLVKT